MKYNGNIKDLLDKSGIYKISCLVSGKFYVGSSRNLHNRFYNHRSKLRCGGHKCYHMQNSWNKYGEDQFIFEILEYVEPIFLMEMEQHYFDTLRPYDRDIGFNICPVAGNNLERPVSEATKKKISDNLRGIPCSETTKTKIRSTFARKAEEFKSFAIEAYGIDYELLNPEGDIVKGRGLCDLAKREGLSASCLSNLIKGVIHAYKGWTRVGGNPREVKTYKLRDPFGVYYEIPYGELKNFAEKNDLEYSALYGVWSKKINHHAGWCRADDKEAYVNLKHDETGEVVTICAYNAEPFRKRYGIPKFKTMVLRGLRPVSYGWRLETSTEVIT